MSQIFPSAERSECVKSQRTNSPNAAPPLLPNRSLQICSDDDARKLHVVEVCPYLFLCHKYVRGRAVLPDWERQRFVCCRNADMSETEPSTTEDQAAQSSLCFRLIRVSDSQAIGSREPQTPSTWNERASELPGEVFRVSRLRRRREFPQAFLSQPGQSFYPCAIVIIIIGSGRRNRLGSAGSRIGASHEGSKPSWLFLSG